MFEEVHSWNSEEGFPKLMERVEKLFTKLDDHGHGCSICGERRYKGQDVTIARIQSWHFGKKTIEELRKMLYPQYPKEKSVPNVCFIRVIAYVHIHRPPSTGCVIAASGRGTIAWRPPREAEKRRRRSREPP